MPSVKFSTPGKSALDEVGEHFRQAEFPDAASTVVREAFRLLFDRDTNAERFFDVESSWTPTPEQAFSLNVTLGDPVPPAPTQLPPPLSAGQLARNLSSQAQDAAREAQEAEVAGYPSAKALRQHADQLAARAARAAEEVGSIEVKA